MKIGISVASAHQVKNVRVGAANMVARAAVACEQGLDSLFVGDHHATAIPYYQNSPILGRMLAVWSNKPAGALYLLPQWNPVLVAEQVATLASIAEGAFVMQCGLGGRNSDMGETHGNRARALEESLQIIRALLAGDTVSHDGLYKLEKVQINPLPPEPVDFWIGASADVAIERVARLGDIWLASPDLNLERAQRKLDVYRDAAAQHAAIVESIAIRQDIHIAETQEQAEAEMKPYLDAGYRGFDPEALVIGSVEKVVERFSALFAMGYTDILVRNMSQNQSQALTTIKLLGKVKANFS